MGRIYRKWSLLATDDTRLTLTRGRPVYVTNDLSAIDHSIQSRWRVGCTGPGAVTGHTKFEEVYGRSYRGELSRSRRRRFWGSRRRTFRRWRDRYQAEGAEGLYDRRLGRASARRAGVDEVLDVLAHNWLRHDLDRRTVRIKPATAARGAPIASGRAGRWWSQVAGRLQPSEMWDLVDLGRCDQLTCLGSKPRNHYEDSA